MGAMLPPGRWFPLIIWVFVYLWDIFPQTTDIPPKAEKAQNS